MFQELFAQTGLSLDRLHALLLLREKGSLIRAADNDPSRQSQMSRYLKELGSFFGVELVTRHGKSLKLTAAGLELAEMASRHLGDLSRFRELALGLPKTVVIASNTNLLASKICPVIGQVSRVVKNCIFQLRNLRPDQILDGLSEQTVSLGVMPKPTGMKGVRIVSLFDWRYGVFVPDRLVQGGSALTVRRALRDCPVAIDGSDERLNRSLTEIAGKLEIPFKPSIFCSSQIECIASVRSGFYASILPLSALDSTENRSLQIVDDPAFDPLSLTIALVWNERHCSVHPHVLDVKDALRRFLEGVAS
jgi:DNA-binding transcriptional LysR family regulator